jgi:hypothetical protein
MREETCRGKATGEVELLAGLGLRVDGFDHPALNAVGVFLDFLPDSNLGYMSFYKASFLSLAVAIATASTFRTAQKE